MSIAIVRERIRYGAVGVVLKLRVFVLLNRGGQASDPAILQITQLVAAEMTCMT